MRELHLEYMGFVCVRTGTGLCYIHFVRLGGWSFWDVMRLSQSAQGKSFDRGPLMI